MRTESKLFSAFGLLLLLGSFNVERALADKSCIRVTLSKEKVTTSIKTVTGSAKCPKNYAKVVDTSTLVGPAGAAGADGQLRIYGDGSAGAKTVSADETLGTPDNDPNIQYTNFTVNSGSTLSVPSGTIIRCTGNFVNNGTITVLTGASGGSTGLSTSTATYIPAHRAAHPGVSIGAAGRGDLTNGTTVEAAGGNGGLGLDIFSARQLYYSQLGGGGGESAGNDPFLFSTINLGSPGGGYFGVLCAGSITNNGVITANGSGFFGGGGGGGGVVILASKTSVSNSSTGVIQAKGGDGESANGDEGASGGGGGGIIHLIAPTATNSGVATVTGGAGGATGPVITTSLHHGGAGGGACGGAGGGGATVPSGASPQTSPAATNGSDGFLFVDTAVDPTALFSH